MTGIEDCMNNTSANVEHDTRELLNVALEAARGAAELVRTRRVELVASGALASTAETKSSDVDPVTVVDKESEDYITRTLAALRPADGILGEEGTALDSQSGIRWVVDPIDGTVNFLYGIPPIRHLHCRCRWRADSGGRSDQCGHGADVCGACRGGGVC